MITNQVYQYLSTTLGVERAEVITEYLNKHECELILCKPRRSKLGDFSVRGKQKRIKINRNLNQFRFMLTLIHEIAHLKTHYELGWKCKPHGEEWKDNYRLLLEIWKIGDLFSHSVELINLFNYEVAKPSACSGIHKEKEAVLGQFDSNNTGVQLGNVAEGQEFIFKEVLYRKIKNRRTRTLCIRLSNQKMYTIHQASLVEFPLEMGKN
ncbi:MAG: SprT-like domain-containing protein [Bacteroidia bacterium]